MDRSKNWADIYLMSATISGIKNISKEIRVDFLNSTLNLDKKQNLNNKRIKAIYGANGAGKSAIITAFDLYQKICSIPNYVELPDVVPGLKELINKKTKKAKICVTFSYVQEGIVSDIFRHCIEITESDIVPYEIKEIFLKAKDVRKSNGEYKTIYEVKDGTIELNIENEFIISEFKKLEKLKLINSTIPATKTQLINIMLTVIEKTRASSTILENPYQDFILALFIALIFPTLFKVYLDVKDRIQYKNPYVDIKKALKERNIDDTIINTVVSTEGRYYYTDIEDIVPKKQLSKYKEKYDKIKDFIRIIKPSLKKILINPIDYDKDNYKCQKIFVYDDYQVNLAYESTGIRKMVELYTYIKSAFEGEIVFIDEIDANISGVFLDKLMECFNEKGRGQLCFTSHNYHSMDVLRKFITITTIGETGMVVDIPKNGNSKPANAFYNGQIMDSPFDIESYDFEKMFVD